MIELEIDDNGYITMYYRSGNGTSCKEVYGDVDDLAFALVEWHGANAGERYA